MRSRSYDDEGEANGGAIERATYVRLEKQWWLRVLA
jgi:hypothetical protein